MKEIIEKLSSYNIFNYLLPGIVFAIFAKSITTYNLVQDEIFLGAFFYYFLGLVISRIGSIFIEPFLKLIKVIQFAKYTDFVVVGEKDEKLNMLSEENNMYRTFCSLFVSLALLKGYEYFVTRLAAFHDWKGEIIVLGLFGLFCLSYRKQTSYITKRIRIPQEKG